MSNAGQKGFEVTPDILRRVEAHAAAGMTKKEIAASLGIHGATLYRKINKDSEFSDAIKTGQAKGIATITNALFVNAKSGNTTAQIFFLKNRSPENWKDRVPEGMEKDTPPPQRVEIVMVDGRKDEKPND